MRSNCDEQIEINQDIHEAGSLVIRSVLSNTEEATDLLQSPIEKILEQLGEDPRREGLRDTPKRYAKAMRFLTSGYKVDLNKLVGKAVFKETTNGIVIVRDIEVFSLCEHHLLPFFGRAHVAYLPSGRVIGLSKIPRIVNAYARRLQVQERLTTEVGTALNELLHPRGVAVVIEAAHMCMMMRGVEKQRSMTTTSFMQGGFLSGASLRQEFFGLLNRNPDGHGF